MQECKLCQVVCMTILARDQLCSFQSSLSPWLLFFQTIRLYLTILSSVCVCVCVWECVYSWWSQIGVCADKRSCMICMAYSEIAVIVILIFGLMCLRPREKVEGKSWGPSFAICAWAELDMPGRRFQEFHATVRLGTCVCLYQQYSQYSAMHTFNLFNDLYQSIRAWNIPE